MLIFIDFSSTEYNPESALGLKVQALMKFVESNSSQLCKVSFSTLFFCQKQIIIFHQAHMKASFLIVSFCQVSGLQEYYRALFTNTFNNITNKVTQFQLTQQFIFAYVHAPYMLWMHAEDAIKPQKCMFVSFY